MSEKLYNDFHNRVKELTNDKWCPYPSDMFMTAIMKMNDDIAIKLINERRKIMFPVFLQGDPQMEDIKNYIGK